MKRLWLLTMVAAALLTPPTATKAQEEKPVIVDEPTDVEIVNESTFRWFSGNDSLVTYMTDFHLFGPKRKWWGRVRVWFVDDPIYRFKLRYYPPPNQMMQKTHSFKERVFRSMLLMGIGGVTALALFN